MSKSWSLLNTTFGFEAKNSNKSNSLFDSIISVPSISKEKPLYGQGYLPFSRDEIYYMPADDVYLSGTAELILNSLHADELFAYCYFNETLKMDQLQSKQLNSQPQCQQMKVTMRPTTF